MDEFEKFFNKALKFLSFRPRSEKEVKDNLVKKKVSEITIQRIIARLKENKFLDDREFTKWWIESRTKFKPRALRLIKMELKQKGIDKDLIEEVVENLESNIDDLASARKLIERRIKKYQGLERNEKFTKVSRFLASRGFNYDIIKEIIKGV